jgi:hypothetical protein
MCDIKCYFIIKINPMLKFLKNLNPFIKVKNSKYIEYWVGPCLTQLVLWYVKMLKELMTCQKCKVIGNN